MNSVQEFLNVSSWLICDDRIFLIAFSEGDRVSFYDLDEDSFMFHDVDINDLEVNGVTIKFKDPNYKFSASRLVIG